MSERSPAGERVSDAELMDPVFLERWSPRSFSGEPVTEAELAALFEAARWSPSCFNNQPWYYVYAVDGDEREAILATFLQGNRLWAGQAPVVGLVVARSALEGPSARSRDFEVGAATMAALIQATKLGLSAHLMGGIDVEAAHRLVGLDPPDDSEDKVICGFAIGRIGDPEALPDFLREREYPSQRKPASEFAFKGTALPAAGKPV